MALVASLTSQGRCSFLWIETYIFLYVCPFFLFLLLVYSFLLADSSMVIRTFVGGSGFPCLILVLLLVLKYKGPYLDFLGLIGVPNVANVSDTSFLVFSGERLVWCPCCSISWVFEVSSGLSFFATCFSPSSLISASSSFVSNEFCSYIFTSLSWMLEFGVYSCVMTWIPMKISLSMSTQSVHSTRFLMWLGESIPISLMMPWWEMCWCFHSITFWLISMMDCRRKWVTMNHYEIGNFDLNLISLRNIKW